LVVRSEPYTLGDSFGVDRLTAHLKLINQVPPADRLGFCRGRAA
jgi:hypothetical protein